MIVRFVTIEKSVVGGTSNVVTPIADKLDAPDEVAVKARLNTWAPVAGFMRLEPVYTEISP